MAQLARMTAQVAPGQSIGRALRLLACFSESHPSHTLSELSRQLELAPSTVSRLLSVLEEYGYVRRVRGNSHYTVGLAPIALASVAISQSDLRRQSLPFLEMLADTSHYSANLAVLYEGDVLFLARVPAAKELRAYTITGTRNAPHSHAVGKILLAALPEHAIRALYGIARWRQSRPGRSSRWTICSRNWSACARSDMPWMMRSSAWAGGGRRADPRRGWPGDCGDQPSLIPASRTQEGIRAGGPAHHTVRHPHLAHLRRNRIT